MKRKITIGIVSLLALIASCVGALVAYAGPSYFVQNTTTSATTSVAAYIATPGTATTTYQLDSYTNGTSQAGTSAVESNTALLIQFSASSTSATLNWRYEYSQDGQNWFGDSLATSTTDTTGNIVNDSPFVAHTWNFASTSPTLGPVGTSQIYNQNKIVNVPTPTRYVRAVFYAPIGSFPVGIWANWVAKRQNY